MRILKNSNPVRFPLIIKIIGICGLCFSSFIASADVTATTQCPANVQLGSTGNGIAASDNASGTGWILWSEQEVFSRFSPAPHPGNADHLIAVRYVNNQWYYDNNLGLKPFTPASSDCLLATVDFDSDSVSMLSGVDAIVNGIDSGYSTSDLAIRPNIWAGTSNPGEFGVTGSTISQGTGTNSLKTLVINEFVTSNENGYEDEEGVAGDWIEILNTGSSSVQLEGIYLTDDDSELNQWQFPQYSLAPGEFVTVFATGNDRKDTLPLHTNFKLKASGEYLAIVDTDGVTVIDELSPEYPQQYEDVSYGLNAANEYVFFLETTPNADNSNDTYEGVVTVEFSKERGFYDSSFALELEANEGAAEIRYTTDGSEPKSNSGLIYQNPITISGTSIVRAKAFKNGYNSETQQSHTYVFIDSVLDQPATVSGYPNNSYSVGHSGQTATHDYEMDPAIAQSATYINDLKLGMKEIPTISLGVDMDEFFGNSGFYETEDIEVPVSVEIFYGDDRGKDAFALAGIESHSWNRLKRSMRINFRSEYGYSKLESDIMENGPVADPAVADKFDRLILRAGNNRSWARNWNPDYTTHTVDQFYRDTQIAMSGLGSHGNFSHLFINGLYWGMYNPVERPDDNFMAEYLGDDDDDWFFIKHGSSGKGDNTRYQTLVNDVLNRNMSSASNYNLLSQYVDIEKFVDYVILNFYTAASDWPQNNFYGGYRASTAPSGSTPMQFYAWDGEWSWNRQQPGHGNASGKARVHSDFLSGASITASSPVIARIWHALIDNSEFRAIVKNRVNELTAPGAALSDEKSLERWDTLTAYIRNAVVVESARWGDAIESIDGKTRTRNDDWQDAVDEIRGFISGNAQALKNAMSSAGYY